MTNLKQTELAKGVRCTGLQKKAWPAPADRSANKRGWVIRKHIALLLHNPAFGESIVSKIVQPFRTKYVPPRYLEM